MDLKISQAVKIIKSIEYINIASITPPRYALEFTCIYRL